MLATFHQPFVALSITNEATDAISVSEREDEGGIRPFPFFMMFLIDSGSENPFAFRDGIYWGFKFMG